MFNEIVNIQTVLDNLIRELDKIDKIDYIIEVVCQLDNISLPENDREKVDAIKVLISSFIFDVKDFIDYWNKYSNTYKIAVEKDTTKLNDELNKLKTKYNQLLSRYNQVVEKEEQFNKNMETLLKAIELIENNTKLISGVNGARQRMINKASVARKTSIDDDELKRLYIESGYKVTDQMVRYFNEKEKITYNGLRMRLIALGVWKGR